MKKDKPMQPVTIGVSDAARLSSVSERTIWRMIKRGELEAVQFGGRRLIRRDSLDKLLGGAVDEGR